MSIPKDLLLLAKEAKKASFHSRLISTEEKNRTLLSLAEALHKHRDQILQANRLDIENAKTTLPSALVDRLSLKRDLDEMILSVRRVVKLDDPIGEIIEEKELPNGLKLQKKRVSIGVLAVIYEARPNVTIEVSSLMLKTGNCALLRAGKEVYNTNRILEKVIQSTLSASKFPKETIQLIKSTDRSQVKSLLQLNDYLDMIIPRGGRELHRFCQKQSALPVIAGGIGICHLFVDTSADLKKAIGVIFNAKTDRPSVCNALDTLLVHREIAFDFLPLVVKQLQTKEVFFHLDPKSWEILKPSDEQIFQRASEKDWGTEWLSLALNIKVVDSLREALAHIQTYSSGHSDGILTNSAEHATIFTEMVDSAIVYINASTRFTDGSAFGLGGEVAVSTQKLHARGPVGLRELTSYKWIVEGDYHIRRN